MYDTLICSLDVHEAIDERDFSESQTTTDLETGEIVVRMWFNPKDLVIRSTYWRKQSGGAGGRLRLEFSVSKLAGADVLANITQDQADEAIDKATAFVRQHFNSSLPHVRSWRVSRIDYCWNFALGKDAPQYLALLSSLHVGSMLRHPFPDSGVVWKTKSRNARWVKFYDKSKLEGEGSGVVRFEVSNYRKVIGYMTSKQFGCEPIVSEVLKPGRALYCMAVQWDRLGLGVGDTYRAEGVDLIHRLRVDFPRGAASAYYALTVIRAYGSDAHRVYNLLASNSYYKWRKKLIDAGYLTAFDSLSSLSLPLLVLPAADVFVQAPQNLDAGRLADTKPPQKISTRSWAEWQKIAGKLDIIATKPSPFLLQEWRKWSGAGSSIPNQVTTIRIGGV